MPEASSQPTSAATTAAAPAAGAPVNHFGENRGIKFHIKAGTSTWACTLQDRSHYERIKAARTGSTDSVTSSASSVSDASR
ncbi:hypothetical protein ISF_01106 [Cordyceps fumosorosea ARSEF 2679]|uniref:Uncharacterized protein n=1 Tax=Cordyceps fumosorosea (strain ARSEF 2679) TaxID=1081104 RepID=A0A168ETM1_CORFA|nr:hypothetical protein ISF_01106 [Cordyceps fumosorosea ARSEF 2679]OAA74205.1 hypothetical protein ISF_01106 [Cordyceps fumosorosea ARSEF 2679]